MKLSIIGKLGFKCIVYTLRNKKDTVLYGKKTLIFLKTNLLE